MTTNTELTAKQKRKIKRQVQKEINAEFREAEQQFLDSIDPSELLPSRDEMPKLLNGSDYDWGSFDWPRDDD